MTSCIVSLVNNELLICTAQHNGTSWFQIMSGWKAGISRIQSVIGKNDIIGASLMCWLWNHSNFSTFKVCSELQCFSPCSVHFDTAIPHKTGSPSIRLCPALPEDDSCMQRLLLANICLLSLSATWMAFLSFESQQTLDSEPSFAAFAYRWNAIIRFCDLNGRACQVVICVRVQGMKTK